MFKSTCVVGSSYSIYTMIVGSKWFDGALIVCSRWIIIVSTKVLGKLYEAKCTKMCIVLGISDAIIVEGRLRWTIVFSTRNCSDKITKEISIYFPG